MARAAGETAQRTAETAGQPAGQRPERLVERAAPAPVEGGHQRGQVADRPAARRGAPGANGSWTWTTSNPPARRARSARTTAGIERVTGATEPLAGQRPPSARWPPASIPVGASAGGVQRGEDRDPVAPRPEGPGQSDDLALDAPGPRQAVGADQGDGSGAGRSRRRRLHQPVSPTWSGAPGADST